MVEDKIEGSRAGGLWLRRRRESMGLTQRELEARTGGKVSYATISLLETGQTATPGMSTLVELGKVLGYTPNEIAVIYGYLDSDPTESAVPEEVRFLLSVLKRVSPGQRYGLLLGVKNMAQLVERGEG